MLHIIKTTAAAYQRHPRATFCARHCGNQQAVTGTSHADEKQLSCHKPQSLSQKLIHGYDRGRSALTIALDTRRVHRHIMCRFLKRSLVSVFFTVRKE